MIPDAILDQIELVVANAAKALPDRSNLNAHSIAVVSVAISLKRIADSLDHIVMHGIVTGSE